MKICVVNFADEEDNDDDVDEREKNAEVFAELPVSLIFVSLVRLNSRPMSVIF